MDQRNDLSEDIRDIRNDIQEIKTDTGTINRILVMTHSNSIISDIVETVNSNERRVILLYILKEYKTVSEIAEILKIKRYNVYRYLNPFVEKDYVYSKKKGKNVYYKRIEILDRIRYDNIDGINQIIKSWKETRKMDEIKNEG